jgi:flagellar biosynthetic protein FliP
LFLLLPGALPGAEAAGGLAGALGGLELGSGATPLKVLALVTVFSVVPSVVLLATCFPRLLIVFSFLRRALGAPDLPSNQVVAGLALVLTAVIMLPVWKRVHADAYLPLSRGEIRPEEAIEKASVPIKRFLLAHTLKNELKLAIELSSPSHGSPTAPPTPAASRQPPAVAASAAATRVEDLDFPVLLAGFVLSELKTAFQIGFFLCLPFLVIDLVVSAVLIAMGMFLLPPVFISLPLKVLVFTLADGWRLVVEGLVQGFKVAV